MDPIKEKIIQQLQKQPEPISSTSLAEQLHVSSRTIKNHIKGINQEQPNLIQATAKGYILNKQMPLPVPEETPAQSYELFSQYSVENIIRIGSAGAYSPDLKVFDVVLADSRFLGVELIAVKLIDHLGDNFHVA